MLQPAFLGGLFIGILSALPIINIANCCCLWVMSGGALAAYLGQQDGPRPFTAMHGAKLGFFAGIIGAFVWLLAALLVDSLMAPLQDRLVTEMLSNANDMPPEVRGWFEMLGTRANAPFRYAAGFFFQLLGGVIFATLGGVLTAVFLRRDGVPPALGGDPIVPPPIPPGA